MIPSWIPASSLARRGDPQKDCAKLRLRPHLSHFSNYIPASASSLSPTPLSPTRSDNPTMQSVPESRQQTFEEIYGPPENFLEIEVSYHPPFTHSYRQALHRSRVSRAHPLTQSYTRNFPPKLQRPAKRPTRFATRKRTARRETCTPRTRSCAAPTSPPSS